MSRKKTGITPPLVSIPEFQDAVRIILSKSKQESNEKMSDFQASNKARRESKKAK